MGKEWMKEIILLELEDWISFMKGWVKENTGYMEKYEKNVEIFLFLFKLFQIISVWNKWD